MFGPAKKIVQQLLPVQMFEYATTSPILRRNYQWYFVWKPELRYKYFPRRFANKEPTGFMVQINGHMGQHKCLQQSKRIISLCYLNMVKVKVIRTGGLSKDKILIERKIRYDEFL